MALDFYGVQLIGRINRFEGDPSVEGAKKIDSVDLWVDSGYKTFGTTKEDLDIEHKLKALSFVQEVTVVVKLGFVSEITMLLTPPFEEALAFLNSDLIRFGVGTLEVSFGYTTGTQDTSLPWVGLLVMPDVQISGSDISITLKAVGAGYPMSCSNASEAQHFVGMTPAEVVIEVLKRYEKFGLFKVPPEDDLFPDIKKSERIKNGDKSHPFFKDVTITDGDGNPSTEIPARKADVEDASSARNGEVGATIPAKSRVPPKTETATVTKGPKNDWWFISSLLRLYGLTIITHEGKVRIRQPISVLAEGARDRNTFALRGKIEPEKRIYPIMSFSSPTKAVFIAQGRVGAIAEDHVKNEETNQKALTAARHEQVGDQVGLEGGGVDASASVLPLTPGQQLSQGIISEFHRAVTINGTEVIIESVGIPDMLPEGLATVVGFSMFANQANLYDGDYRVIEVTHNIGLGGYTTTWRGIRISDPDALVSLNTLSKRDAKARIEELRAIGDDERKQIQPPAEEPTEVTSDDSVDVSAVEYEDE